MSLKNAVNFSFSLRLLAIFLDIDLKKITATTVQDKKRYAIYTNGFSSIKRKTIIYASINTT